jgi:tetratricopeptide (TPR) repeat protein
MYRAGQAWHRAGDDATAMERFDWLAAHGSPEAREARGAFEAARLRLATGQVERAEREFLELARRAPGSGPARRGIELVLLARDERDPTGTSALAWIDAVQPSLRGTELGATLLRERARRLERLERSGEALATYEALLALPYPQNTHWDDGGLAYARLLVAQGRPGDAIRVIDRVLAVREVSTLPPGSYQRPRFGELQLLRARILRDEVHDAAAAAESFHQLYATFPSSLLRDDALREEAELRATMGQRERACDLFVTLAREFACTRHGRYGLEQARACGRPVPEDAAGGCPHERRRARDDGDGVVEVETERR